MEARLQGFSSPKPVRVDASHTYQPPGNCSGDRGPIPIGVSMATPYGTPLAMAWLRVPTDYQRLTNLNSSAPAAINKTQQTIEAAAMSSIEAARETGSFRDVE